MGMGMGWVFLTVGVAIKYSVNEARAQLYIRGCWTDGTWIFIYITEKAVSSLM